MQAQAIANVMGGASVLDAPVTSATQLRQQIGRGLAVEALERVTSRIYTEAQARRALMHRVVPEGSLKRRLHGGRLSPAESERTARLANVIAHAEEVWRDVRTRGSS
jgi:putative toxin-antitoxin system antitoxin component (TIGR02293 family)